MHITERDHVYQRLCGSIRNGKPPGTEYGKTPQALGMGKRPRHWVWGDAPGTALVWKTLQALGMGRPSRHWVWEDAEGARGIQGVARALGPERFPCSKVTLPMRSAGTGGGDPEGSLVVILSFSWLQIASQRLPARDRKCSYTVVYNLPRVTLSTLLLPDHPSW